MALQFLVPEMSFDEEDKTSKGEKNWAKEREWPTEAEAAEGMGHPGSVPQRVRRQERGWARCTARWRQVQWARQ